MKAYRVLFWFPNPIPTEKRELEAAKLRIQLTGLKGKFSEALKRLVELEQSNIPATLEVAMHDDGTTEAFVLLQGGMVIESEVTTEEFLEISVAAEENPEQTSIVDKHPVLLNMLHRQIDAVARRILPENKDVVC